MSDLTADMSDERNGFFGRMIGLAIAVAIVAVVAVFAIIDNFDSGLDERLTRIENVENKRIEEVYKSRAVQCRVQLGLGIPLKDNCLDPHVTAYFDPNEAVLTTAAKTGADTKRIMCAVVNELDAQVPECGS